ncbi:MAG: hypothetical protein E7231_10720 [Cellulosilyticum sp.]|nr:hypothetical protein [Cellulosilyticum sp.]
MKLIKKRLISTRGIYGIRKKLLVYALGSMIVIISLVVGLITSIVMKSIEELTIEKYQYLNDKVITKIHNEFEASDELFKKYIGDSVIQETLANSKVPADVKEKVQHMMAYIDFKDMLRATYIDNKGNVYGARLICFNYKDFIKSNLYKTLGEDYSTTKWVWKRDSLFGANEDALFMMRYIRHMEYPVEPGVLILKMSDYFFKNIISDLDKEIMYLFWDSDYNLCYIQSGEGQVVNDKVYQSVFEAVKGNKSGIVKQLDEGMLFTSQEENSQIHVAMLVPREKIDVVFREIKYVIVISWIFLCGLAVVTINYLTSKYVNAIYKINTAMKGFDREDYSSTLYIKTDTELDEIACSYNQMVKRINHLVHEVKLREQVLRKSELNSLMYQINPHFLYNTLDNIYMMARLNRDEKMKKMIESLSKFLRIGLSNGKQEITIEEELQHIRSYIEIMRMREDEEFEYTIECQEALKKVKILKLILQPIVENCIKYGFQDLDELEKMVIEINVVDKSSYILLTVKNNGGLIEEDILNRLNQLQHMPYDENIPEDTGHKGGYGIRNVVNRLKLRYGEAFSLWYESNRDVGTICSIKIPNQNENM